MFNQDRRIEAAATEPANTISSTQEVSKASSNRVRQADMCGVGHRAVASDDRPSLGSIQVALQQPDLDNQCTKSNSDTMQTVGPGSHGELAFRTEYKLDGEASI